MLPFFKKYFARGPLKCFTLSWTSEWVMLIWHVKFYPVGLTTQVLITERHQSKLWKSGRFFSYRLSSASVELQIEHGYCKCFSLVVIVSTMNIIQLILLVWLEVSQSLHTDNTLAGTVRPQAALVLPLRYHLNIQIWNSLFPVSTHSG